MKSFIKFTLILILFIFCISCDKTTKLKCSTPFEEYTFIIKNGQVINYFNNNIEQSEDIITGFNKDYLQGITTDKEAVSTIKTVISRFDGICK